MIEERQRAYSLLFTLWLSSAGASMQVFALISFASLMLDAKLFHYFAEVGAFICGLGFGAYLEKDNKRTTKKELERAWDKLSGLQFRISRFGMIGIPFSVSALLWLDYWRREEALFGFVPQAIAVAGVAIVGCFWLGISVGRQLPILSSIFKKRKLEEESFRFLFGLDYLGCAIGPILYLLWFYPQWGWVTALALAVIFSCLGNIGSLFLLKVSPRKHLMLSLIYVTLAGAAITKRETIENAMDNLLFGF